MRSFLIVWLVAFCLIAEVASVLSWYVGKAPVKPATAETRRPVSPATFDTGSAAP